MQSPTFLRHLALLSAVATISGCGPDAKQYQAIHRSAQAAVPIAVEMEKLFGVTDHFITHFGFRSEKTNIWNTVAYFGGRYTLTMQINVTVDYDANQITAIGEPTFHLVELISTAVYSDGRTSSHHGKNFSFSKEEWETIYDSKGDFAAIGIELSREAVPGFEAYVASWRKPRVPVSLLGNNP